MAFSEPMFGIDPGLLIGRKVAAGDLGLLILSLIAANPRHGYELIGLIAGRTGGYYKPSPGMVYPALLYIHSHGEATIEASATRKRYRITEAGRSRLADNRRKVAELWDRLETRGRQLAAPASDMPESALAWRSRLALDQALRARRNASPPDQLRIARILDQATTQILSDCEPE